MTSPIAAAVLPLKQEAIERAGQYAREAVECATRRLVSLGSHGH